MFVTLDVSVCLQAQAQNASLTGEMEAVRTRLEEGSMSLLTVKKQVWSGEG